MPYLLRTWRLYYIYSWNSKDVNRILRRKEKVMQQMDLEHNQQHIHTVHEEDLIEMEMKEQSLPPQQQTQQHSPQQQQQQQQNHQEIDDSISVGDLEDDYHSEWTEVVKERLTQMQSNVNKQRASESNMLKFFIIFGFILLTVIVPWTIIDADSVPQSEVLCAINARQTNNQNVYIYGVRLPYPALPVTMHAVISILMLIAVFMLRNVKDSYYLNVELRLCTLISIFETVILIFTTFTKVSFLFVTFKVISSNAMQLLVIHWPAILAIENFIRIKVFREITSINFENDNNNNERQVPRDIRACLLNEECRDLLRAHLAKALCSENIMFYEDTLEYKSLHPEVRREKAKQIIETYVMPSSLREINVSGSIKKRIRQRYEKCEEDGTEAPFDLFSQALDSLEVMMNENGSFASFLRSAEYKQWANNVKKQILRRQIENAGGL
jgi:hypothetical protein